MKLRGSVTAVVVAGLWLSMTGPSAASPTARAGSAADRHSDGVSGRNRVERAGNVPQWVQLPYLVQDGERAKVVARLYVDPLRTTRSGKGRVDRLRLGVTVARPKWVRGTNRSVALLPPSQLLERAHSQEAVRRRGVVTMKVGLGRDTTRRLMTLSYGQRLAALSVVVTHRKDTVSKTPAWDLQQVSAGPLARAASSRKDVRGAARLAREQRRLLHRIPTVPGRGWSRGARVEATGKPGSPYYNNIYLVNSSPFEQQVNFQPNIQCMWTGVNPTKQQPAVQTTVAAGATVTVQYIGQPQWAPPRSADQPYKGWSTSNRPLPGLGGGQKGLNAPGTQGSLTQDLTNSANVAGQAAVGSLGKARTYSGPGMVGLVAGATVRFAISFFRGMGKKDTCTNTSTYPQLFGLSTAVTGFGSNGVTQASQAVLPATQTWAGDPAAGNQGSVTAPPDPDFVAGTLQPSLGATTTALYYWNGGAPAPFGGGSASFQGGLIQYLGPNPGTSDGSASCYYENYELSSGWQCPQGLDGPQKEPYPYCNGGCVYDPYGEMTIQLAYLTNPAFSSGIVNQGGAPVMSAQANGQGGFTLSCDLADMNATLYTPFGESAPTAVGGTTLATTPVNAAGGLPEDADWLVTFFGVDAQDNYVYFADSLTAADDGVLQPYLAPNAASQQISLQAAATGGSGAVALGTVDSDDLQAMTTQDGQPATPVSFGCAAAPSVGLPDLSIVQPDGSSIAEAYGNNWPMPTQADTGWPVGSFKGNRGVFDWGWQQPVPSVSVAFQGSPLADTTQVPAG